MRTAQTWLRRLPVAGILVAASLVLTACGSADSPTILNTEKVERAIEQSALDQRNQRAQVSCPSGVHQEQGLEFSCSAVVKERNTRFVVTQLDDAGHVQYKAR